METQRTETLSYLIEGLLIKFSPKEKVKIDDFQIDFSDIYRINIEDTEYNEIIGDLHRIGIDKIIRAWWNFFTPYLEEIEKWFDEPKKVFQILKNLFEIYDLTPFIEDLRGTLSFDSKSFNQFSVDLFDFYQEPFLNPQFEEELKQVRAVEINEMDFLILLVHSSKEKGITYKDIKDKELLKKKGIETHVYGAGFITNIRKERGVGEIPKISLQVMGIKKIFAINALISTLALAEQFSSIFEFFDIPSPEKMSIWQKRFHDMNPFEIVELLFRENLGTIKIVDIVKEKDITRQPHLLRLSPDLLISFKEKNKIFPGIQLVLLLIFVKSFLSTFLEDVAPHTILIFRDTFSTLRTPEKIESFLDIRPYLTMVRTSFSLFESEYEAPIDIFSRLQTETFLYFYEQRNLIFEFGSLAYNEADEIIEIPRHFIKRMEFQKTDSSLYSCIAVKNVLPLVGELEIPGRIFVNPLLTFKYGIRIPRVVTNPNIIHPRVGDLFAEFYSDVYNSLSRTLTVTMIFDPKIKLNRLVAVSFDEKNYYVGLVTSISDSINVGGECTQSLTLSFAREAIKRPGKRIEIKIKNRPKEEIKIEETDEFTFDFRNIKSILDIGASIRDTEIIETSRIVASATGRRESKSERQLTEGEIKQLISLLEKENLLLDELNNLSLSIRRDYWKVLETSERAENMNVLNEAIFRFLGRFTEKRKVFELLLKTLSDIREEKASVGVS